MVPGRGVNIRVSLAARARSGVEPEVHHVPVLDEVFLALEPEPAGIARAGLALEADVIRIRDGLGPDEALLEIRVDHAGRLRRPRAPGDRPGAGLLRADREIGDEAEELVARPDDPVEAGLGQADRVEIVLLLGRIEDRDLA